MGRGRQKYDYTYEEYLEIKKENKRKLEEIMTTPDYMYILAKKYYGERWFQVMPDSDERKEKRRKDLIAGRISATGYIDRKVIQLDMDGEFVKEWESARIWAEEEIEEEKRYSASQHVAKVATGKGDTAYGYRWAFADDYYNNKKEE